MTSLPSQIQMSTSPAISITYSWRSVAARLINARTVPGEGEYSNCFEKQSKLFHCSDKLFPIASTYTHSSSYSLYRSVQFLVIRSRTSEKIQTTPYRRLNYRPLWPVSDRNASGIPWEAPARRRKGGRHLSRYSRRSIPKPRSGTFGSGGCRGPHQWVSETSSAHRNWARKDFPPATTAGSLLDSIGSLSPTSP